ncbi:Regucalcin [Pseudolycoriella hygida]|uniref:Regucalcin n=1 Tax=Pseudolycoriella hygida TaxID=35572 RepID=A0A9Q0S114_9DIPT|nr:Regucalcin [Pseudolycoriella hygida]
MEMKNEFLLIVLIWNSLLGITCMVEGTPKPQVERLPSPRTTLGEIPHWSQKTLSLYYVDIHGPNSLLLRYDYQENRVYSASVSGAPSLLFLLPIACTKDQFLVGIDRTTVVVQWDGRSPEATILRPLFEVDCETSNYTTFNDVKTDERGRFYGGTKFVEKGVPCTSVAEPIAAFYGYESGKCVKKFFGNVILSNGLTWVRPTNKFYYIDSCTYDIKQFDYDPRTGDLSNGHQIFSSIMQNGTKPDYIFDGMTNDQDGNLYVATFGGSKIIKLNPRTKKILMEIELPATQVTSLAFGGPKLDILFVTTANKDGKQPEG